MNLFDFHLEKVAGRGLAVLFLALCFGSAGLSLAEAGSSRVKILSSKISAKKHAETIRKFQVQISKAKRQLLKKGGKGAALNFTSVNVVDDCSASVTCGDGTVLTCSIQGPGTCESGSVSIACIQGNTSETNTCSGHN